MPKKGGEIIPGSRAVDTVEDIFKKRKGYEILGREISFVNPATGQLRRYDLVVRTPGRKIIGIEVKSGTASRNAAQRTFDKLVNSRSSALRATGRKAAELNVTNINKVLLYRVP
ncbi:DUF4143 domain-containing protein [Lignipirellula cremea]|uniref:DUF4143 domain-containing protein n=1 Tax=Lignipirellula cremea TaxID=2528010 RepID=UPI001E619DF9|nr:DUF4143 domain-containing protein [Lignipirellula cremea]